MARPRLTQAQRRARDEFRNRLAELFATSLTDEQKQSIGLYIWQHDLPASEVGRALTHSVKATAA